jgi:RNA polymerase primary sigma factor
MDYLADLMAKENDILSDYLNTLYGIEPLPIEEEHELAKRIAAGDDAALDRLITHNLRFVVYIVRNMTAWHHGKVPVEDMVAMGNEALFTAARRWVPKNNARFATYAKSFIEKGVRRDLDNTANLIRLPINIMEQMKRLNYVERSMTQSLGYKPKSCELAKILGISEGEVHLIKSYVSREPVSLDNINQEKFMEELGDD